MKKIVESPFVVELIDTLDNMYRLGWHERNSGNASYLLTDVELLPYISELKIKANIELQEPVPALSNRYILVSGTGKYFKNAKQQIENTLGIIKINQSGTAYDIVWGFNDFGKPTSELPTHLSVHATKLGLNPNHRMVLHSHATHLLALSFVLPLEDKAFTKVLWKYATESIVVFPEGIGVLPWMVCGNVDIAKATTEKMKTVNVVIWALHGVFAAGNTIDETFGLIEAMDKAAQIYFLASNKGIKQDITDDQLKDLAKKFHVKPHEGYLE